MLNVEQLVTYCLNNLRILIHHSCIYCDVLRYSKNLSGDNRDIGYKNTFNNLYPHKRKKKERKEIRSYRLGLRFIR